MDKPEIHARRNPEGDLNLSDIFGDQTTQDPPQSQESPQFRFAVKYIKCKNGTIDYIDTQRSLDLRIDGITIEVKGPPQHMAA